MLTSLLVLGLGCEASTDDTSSTSPPTIDTTILSPAEGAELYEEVLVWLEVEARDLDGWALALEDVTWSVHGTDWEILGNAVETLLPRGWGLLIVEALAEGTAVTASVEVRVEDGAGDTGSTGSTTEDVLLGHTITFAYTPSKGWRSQGYTECIATYGSDLVERTGAEICPDGDITWEGTLARLGSDCDPVLTASIPDQVAYGMDTSSNTSWRVWIEATGAWQEVGATALEGADHVVTVTNRLDASGSYAGTADVTMRFSP